MDCEKDGLEPFSILTEGLWIVFNARKFLGQIGDNFGGLK